MQDREVLIKMVVSALAGFLAFVAAMFTTMLDLPILWRNIWLGVCLALFVISLIGVFYLCGDLNEPEVPKEN